MNAPLIIGVVSLAVVIWHEISWWKRRQWQRVTGTVVDIHERREKNKTSYHPVISFMAAEGERQFTSKYGGNVHPKVGDEVTVLVSPDGESQEHYSISNRWFISAIAYDEAGKYWIAEATGIAIIRLIGEMHGFEYYIVDREMNWMLCENHHSVFIRTNPLYC